MGVYDEIVVGNREGQVKLWHNGLHTYKVGERPPAAGFPKNYSIAMREGGFVNIHEGALVSWTDEPLHLPIFDKWGDEFTDEETKGLLGENYVHNPS